MYCPIIQEAVNPIGKPNTHFGTSKEIQIKQCKSKQKKENKTAVVEIEEEKSITVTASFELSDYLIPKVFKLIELGAKTEKSSSSRGSAYEKLVAEIFK